MESETKRLEGKKALITGATTGIGKAVASLFLSEGAAVAVNYHRENEARVKAEEEFRSLLEAIEADQSKLVMIMADVSNEQQVAVLFAETIDTFGGLDILVNNAGVQSEKASHLLTGDDLMQNLGVNLLGSVYCSVAALRHFVERKVPGCILTNTSVHERIPKPKFLPYSISKGGLRSMTQTLALEYASLGIRVNSVAPGVVETPMNKELKDAETRQDILEHVPQGIVISPDEVARAFLYLASDAARNVTGQTLFIDGGLSLYPDFEDNWSSR